MAGPSICSLTAGNPPAKSPSLSRRLAGQRLLLHPNPPPQSGPLKKLGGLDRPHRPATGDPGLAAGELCF